ncbi:uncharacterized protein LOC123317239 [Coccinella septempunctata]|uniref:uncharacterized protein LOC123317239 n=1 Tax=Coccinella septempunctata TaxID=41139 RepID=UPI001D05E4AD|nr:uncharacterized protein LOC123317239 [Coccinella septempunctata]
MDNFEQIANEDERDQSIGYFLRSKRRKLENDREEVKYCESVLPERQRKKKAPILDLPTEVLSHILKFISYQDLGYNVRLVSRRFKEVTEDLMGVTFKMLEKKIKGFLKFTLEAVQVAEGDSEIKCYCRLINMLEILNFQQNVVMSTIWRYAYNNRYETHKSSMYAGLLIDTYEQFLWKFAHMPDQLYAPVLGRDYAMPAEVTAIIQMTKSFCLHFEKTNEEMVNNSLMVSGAKLLDLLDSASFAQKDVIYENVEGNIFKARYNYFFNNSWFVALNISTEKQMTWKQRQRMMHMRIRRILLAHTEMFMQQYQYEREVMLRKSDDEVVKLKRPSNNVYTGYGDIQDKFFYYGVMNDGAYVQKFHPEDQLNDDDIEDLLEEDPEEMAGNRNGSEDSRTVQVPYLGTHVDVKISCPLSHAPMRYLDVNYPLDSSELTVKRCQFENGKFSLKLKFHCPGAKYPRLPTTYLYKFKHT